MCSHYILQAKYSHVWAIAMYLRDILNIFDLYFDIFLPMFGLYMHMVFG